MCFQIGDALFVDLPRVRLDGGAKAFRQRWGYELSPPPPLLEEEEGEGEGEPAETASLREEGSVHTVSPLVEPHHLITLLLPSSLKQNKSNFDIVYKNFIEL